MIRLASKLPAASLACAAVSLLGCSEPTSDPEHSATVTAALNWLAVEKLGPPDQGFGDGEGNDHFGVGIALDGDTVLLGAAGDLLGTDDFAGSAYVFRSTATGFVEEAKLAIAPPEHTGNFGLAVALSGDTALVGARNAAIGSNHGQGAAWVFVRSSTTWTEQAKLVASDGAEHDGLGFSVALVGDTAFVGAPFRKVGANTHAGAIYLFSRSGTAWTENAKLIASDPMMHARLGISLAVDGATVLAGAPHPYGSSPGAAHVFVQQGLGWMEQAKLAASDGNPANRFGNSVALSNGTALVGAWHADGAAGNDQGAAYVFTQSGTSWTEQAKLTASDAAETDQLGVSVALSGEVALVGAHLRDEGGQSNLGAAYAFVRSGSVWSEEAKLLASDGAPGDGFGAALALQGDLAVVGSVFDDVGQDSKQGSAYAFERAVGAWTQQGQFTNGSGHGNARFGHGVALDGDRAVVGAPFADATPHASEGVAWILSRTAGSFTTEARLIASDGEPGARFGSVVALSGEIALVAAPGARVGANAEQGAAYVFARTDSEWQEEAKLTDPTGGAFLRFGKTLALDGDTALIAHDVSQGPGLAYVFVRSAGIWSLEATLLPGGGPPLNYFGEAVALDGDTAIVGAPGWHSPPYSPQGAARVFIRNAGAWSLEATLVPLGAPDADDFGASVALRGDRALVAAPSDGKVYLFERDEGVWTQQAEFAGGYAYGHALALSDHLLVIGGSVTYDNVAVWLQIGPDWEDTWLSAGCDACGFGDALAIDDRTLLVGAPYDDGVYPRGNPDEGRVHVFDRVCTPLDETCDGIDDDCDGEIDDEATCPDGGGIPDGSTLPPADAGGNAGAGGNAAPFDGSPETSSGCDCAVLSRAPRDAVPWLALASFAFATLVRRSRRRKGSGAPPASPNTFSA